MDEKQIRSWLSHVAYLYKKLWENSKLGELELCICNENVQLYKCIRKIVQLLGIPCEERVIRYEDGSVNNRVSFLYEGIEFFELEDCNAGND